MSIDEAIENLKYDVEIDMYIRDIAPQIAEWLEELKDYQDKNKMVVRVDVENVDSIKDKIDELSRYAESQYNKGYSKAENDYYALSEKDRQSSYDCGYNVGYNMALDDFVHKVKEHQYVLSDVINSKDYGMFTIGIEQIAEQLKERD